MVSSQTRGDTNKGLSKGQSDADRIGRQEG